MRSITTLTSLLLAASVATGVAGDKPTLTTEDDKASYALGLQYGKTLSMQGVELDTDLFSTGLKDGVSGEEALLTDEEARETLMAFQMKMQQQIQERMAKEAVENKEAGDTYLAENKERDGVVTTESGLQYEILTPAEGDEKPTATDTVKVHYTGKLIDGTVFDSSVERGEPITFPVSGVIPGWSEALQLMTVGSKYRLVIPSDLAYREQGAPPRIGPNAVLDFEVELLGINPTPPQGFAPKAARPGGAKEGGSATK